MPHTSMAAVKIQLDSMSLFISKFYDNEGGTGGAVGSAYLPFSFLGENIFKGSRGHSLVVSGQTSCSPTLDLCDHFLLHFLAVLILTVNTSQYILWDAELRCNTFTIWAPTPINKQTL